MLSIGAAHGLGLPRSCLTPGDAKNALLFGWINQVIALVAIGSGKVAIVAFLFRIQGVQSRARTGFLCALAGSNLVVNCVAAALIVFQCSPVQKLWNEKLPGVCSRREVVQIFGYVQGCEFPSSTLFNANAHQLLTAWSSFCDLALALYPISIFWGVRAISTRAKIGLCALMGAGIL